MKNTTLLFLIKKDSDKVSDVLLAMKKIGFGVGRYNGVGGKVKEGETIEEAAARETKEEIGVDVDVKNIVKMGEIEFRFEDKVEWNQMVHIYTTEVWNGEPVESEEMKPYWYKVEDIVKHIPRAINDYHQKIAVEKNKKIYKHPEKI